MRTLAVILFVLTLPVSTLADVTGLARGGDPERGAGDHGLQARPAELHPAGRDPAPALIARRPDGG